jgi:Kef-type K+ transport system membrane component KefB
MRRRKIAVAGIVSAIVFVTAAGAAQTDSHEGTIGNLLLALIVILAAAKLGGELAERAGFPAVLGELLGGVVLGNLVLIDSGWNFFEPLRVTPPGSDWAVIVAGLAELGVIILLFEVGLESTVQGMMKVGGSSFLVAVLGVVTPFLLGFGVSRLFIKEIPPSLAAALPPGFSLQFVHMYVGAVLCATSVGITARVFRDINRLNTKEAQIILGAAVIDDVLGLIVLAVVSGIITSAKLGVPMAVGALIRLIVTAVLFLGGSLTLGVYLIPRIMNQLSRLRTSGVMLVSSLLFAFALSWLAGAVGLAPIVGAFAAGLILEEVHFRGFREEITIEQLIRPVSTFLAPVFFVLMGIHVRLEAFGNLAVVAAAGGLTLAAVAGKQVCGFGVLEKRLNRLAIGIGMIPRGEVGLIFANIGKTLGVIDDATFSAIVIMVMITTLITPPLLKLSMERPARSAG